MTGVEAWAPGRVVLVGDHTDHAGGLSLTMAVDRATKVTGHRGGNRLHLTSDQVEGVVDLPRHVVPETATGPLWGRLVAACHAAVGASTGFRGRVTSTLPVGAGLASSAALELALCLAFGFSGDPLELARAARGAEHRALGVPCGLLDQLTAAAAVDGHALLLDLSAHSVTAVPVPETVDVVVVHSGVPRALGASGYAERIAECEAAAARVGPLPSADPDDIDALADPVLRHRARHVRSECARVAAAAEALRAGDVEEVGRLMSASHRSLRDDFAVSTPALEHAVDALDATPGVLGARLTGAGFGGCVVALCERGAIPEPAAVTGQGWLVRPGGRAGVAPAGDR